MADNDNPNGGNPAEALQKLLDKKNGDAMAVAMTLLSENFQLREKNRSLKEQIPQEGARVISKEESVDFDAFKALNLKPSDIKAKLEAHETVASENSALKKETVLRSVADAGYSFDALRDFDSLEGGLEYVLKDETKDGKTVKQVSVRVDGKEQSLDDYALSRRPALASILKTSPTQGGGTPYVPQSPGGRAPAPNKWEKIRQDEKAKQDSKKQEKPLEARLGMAAPV